MQAVKPEGKWFCPFKLEESSTLTPDNPEFYKFDVNLVILTKYGRGVYIRHGNEDRCSSFFATLGTIVNKLELSFGRTVEGREEPATLKCIKQGPLKLYVLKRLNFMYICWSKGTPCEITLYGMIQFVHHQLMSCLTGKANEVLQTNQTYDPSINFGKAKAEHLLLHYAFANGLHSIPIAFKTVPVMPLPQALRSSLWGLMREEKIEGLQINILMTMEEVICVHKQKGIELAAADICLLNTLIQSQSSLLTSEIWYPICLPGVCFDQRVFCYINFLSDQLVHIMVSDEANIFADLSEASKRLKERIVSSGLLDRITLGCSKELINDPTLEKSPFLEHFLFRAPSPDENGLDQIVMSQGAYFGQNAQEVADYFGFYGELQKHYVSHRGSKKEKMHFQPVGRLTGGYCEEGGVVIFFIGSPLAELEDCRLVAQSLSRYVREEETSLWLQKIV